MDIVYIRNLLKQGKTIYDINLKVTFYARVSSEKDEQLNSLDNQIGYYENMIQKNSNWSYIPGYIDEGISGINTTKREQFNKMIQDAKQGKFDLIITKEISRFARNTLDSLTYTRQLLNEGVCVYFQNDNINTIEPDSELRLTIMSSIAQDELRKLSERIKFGHKQSIKNGIVEGNSRIFGYKKDKGRLVIDETQSGFVKELFELYATGEYSMKQLEKIFYEKGYRNYRGNKISHSTMGNIIKNPKYKGYYCGNKVEVVDLFTKKQRFLPESEWIQYKDETGQIVPAIVSEDVWEKANQVFKKRSIAVGNRSTSYKNNIFTNKIFCKKHNTPYYKKQNKTVGRVYDPFWVCKYKIENGKNSCNSMPLYESELFYVLTDVIKHLVENIDDFINEYVLMLDVILNKNNNDDHIDLIKKQISAINKKKDKLLELCVQDILSNSEFKIKNEELNKELSSLKEQLYKFEQNKKNMSQSKEILKEIRSTIKKIYTDHQLKFTKNEVDLLIDKIVVDVVDNRIIFDIYLSFSQKLLIEYDKEKLRCLGQMSLIICHKQLKPIMRKNRTLLNHQKIINVCYNLYL